MSNTEFKKRLADSRKFEKESDYQIVEEIYKNFNSGLINDEFISALFYGLDDETEDLQVTSSLIDIIFSISAKDNISKKLSSIILSNIDTCVPHANYFFKKIIGIVALQRNIDSFSQEVISCKEKESLMNILLNLNEEKDFNSSWVFRQNMQTLMMILGNQI